MKFLSYFAPFYLVFSLSTYASDHIDGPVTLANQVADITDLFAFPTPGRPGFLTLILDVYPFVTSSGHFSDKVNYNFILRKAAIDQNGSRIVTDPASEVMITCKFITPQKVKDTQIICASNESPARIIGQISFNNLSQPTVGNNIDLFGGRRADPFFFSKLFAESFTKFQKGLADGKNVMANLNCLAIVMNVDLNLLFPTAGEPNLGAHAASPSHPEKAKSLAIKTRAKPNRKVAEIETYLVAVAAESVTFDSPGSAPRRIDRVGRPEISNISMNMKSADPEIRDTYNSDRPFSVPADRAATYQARLKKNIKRYDMIDGSQDWSPADLCQLAALLTDDFLVVDPFMPCQQSSFFEIEQSLLQHRPHQSCGGRDPSDNVVNKLYTLYEKGAAAMASVSVSDGLQGPSNPVSTSFPYLADPYNGWLAWVTQKIANAAKTLL